MLGRGQMLMSGGGGAAGVSSMFNTALYTGNGASRTITTGVDLTGAASGDLLQGGLVWIKGRSGATAHRLFDTARGATNWLDTSASTSQTSEPGSLTAFGSSGFSLNTSAAVNTSAATYAAWSFRRAAKFCDVVAYTGNGAYPRDIPHNLGVAPGFVVVKLANGSGGWSVYHRSYGVNYFLNLNATLAATSTANSWGAMTSTHFGLTSTGGLNSNLGAFVAYLFAHDTGPDGVIQCGSYTGNGSASGPTVTLGWEPQWLLVKRSDAAGAWTLVDAARGFGSGAVEKILYPNVTNAESGAVEGFNPSSTGFQVTSTDTSVNASGGSYVYASIRKAS